MAATPRLDRWTFSEVSHQFDAGRLTVNFAVNGDGPHQPTACLRLVDAQGGVIHSDVLAALVPGDAGRPMSRTVLIDAAVWSAAARLVLSLTIGNCGQNPGGDLAVAFYPVRQDQR